VAKEKKRKKETSAVKHNTSGHYRGRRYKNLIVEGEQWHQTFDWGGAWPPLMMSNVNVKIM